MAKKEVWIVMGSDSDADIMRQAYDTLVEFGVPAKMMVSSAHRSPKRTSTIAKSAAKSGCGCFIVGAGAAAHLAGVIAAETTLPIIGVPIDSSALQGLDALLATVADACGRSGRLHGDRQSGERATRACLRCRFWRFPTKNWPVVMPNTRRNWPSKSWKKTNDCRKRFNDRKQS